MGVWGNNNFDSDDALNVLSKWINKIISEIRETYLYDKEGVYNGRGEANIVANIDILATLYSTYKLHPDLELSEIENWKRDYLDTFDSVSLTYAQFEVTERANQRRLIIEATFDHLQQVLTEIIQENEAEEREE